MSASLHDPEPDRWRPTVPEKLIKGAQREWAFWGVMVIGLWAAFQGQPLTAFWFSAVIIAVATIKVVAGPVVHEISKTWKS